MPATTVVLAVQQRTLTLSGVTISDKVYDGTATASFSIAGATLTGRVGSDDVAVSTAGSSALFVAGRTPDPIVGSGKSVVIFGLTLTGTTASNYVLTTPSGTASITPKALTVSGLTVVARSYNGDTAAGITGTAGLVGVVGSDLVTVAGTPVGQFASADAGSSKTVTVSGLSLAGAAKDNYSLQPLSLSGAILAASVSIALGNLEQVYDGAPKPITVTTTPAVAFSVTYGSSGSAPTAAGTYVLSVTAGDANHSGSATGTLKIAKAVQTIALSAPASAPTLGTAIPLSATASSGLPVTLSVVSGSATLSGTSLTLNVPGSVVIRASQAGDTNHEPATAEITVTSTARLTQTIAFAPLANRLTTDAPFTLSASATSGLPVTFALVSGPASLSGATLRLSGAPGAVVVRASQAGNAAYEPAQAVTQTFNVVGRALHQVFFGLTQNNDTIGFSLAPDGRSGPMVCYVAATRETFVISFSVNTDGTFTATVTTFSTLAETRSDGPPTARAGAVRTLSGQLVGNTISGGIAELGITFSAAVQPASGSTAAISGLYVSDSINSSGGVTTTLVGTEGQMIVVTTVANLNTGAAGTVDASGRFTVQAPGATIAGAIDQSTTIVTGSVTSTSGAATTFVARWIWVHRGDTR